MPYDPNDPYGTTLFGLAGGQQPGAPMASLTPETDYWNQPVMGGIPLHRFVSLAGTLAAALDPQRSIGGIQVGGFGGRLGGALAGMADQSANTLLHSEQGIRQQQMKMAAEAAQERQQQVALNGLLSRFQPRGGGFGVQEGQPEAPGATSSAFGAPPVTTNLEGVNRPPTYPRLSAMDVAGIASLMGTHAKPVLDYYTNAGQLVSPMDLETNRNLSLATDPRVMAMTPNALTTVTTEKGVPTVKRMQPENDYQVLAWAAQNAGSPMAQQILNTLRFYRETPAQSAERGILEGTATPGAERLVGLIHPGRAASEGQVMGPGQTYVPRGFLQQQTNPWTAPLNPTKSGKPTGRDLDVEAFKQHFAGMTDQEINKSIDVAPATIQAKMLAAKQAIFQDRRQEILSGVGRSSQPVGGVKLGDMAPQGTQDGSFRLRSGQTVTVRGGRVVAVQ